MGRPKKIRKRIPDKDMERRVERTIMEGLPWSIDDGIWGEKQRKYRAILERIKRTEGIEAMKAFIETRRRLYRARKETLKALRSWVMKRVERYPDFYGVFVHGSFAYGKAEPRDIDLIPLVHPKADKNRLTQIFLGPDGITNVPLGERRIPLDPFAWGGSIKDRSLKLGFDVFLRIWSSFRFSPTAEWFEERGIHIKEFYVGVTPDLFIGDPAVHTILREMVDLIKKYNPAGESQLKEIYEKHLKNKIEEYMKKRGQKMQ